MRQPNIGDSGPYEPWTPMTCERDQNPVVNVQWMPIEDAYRHWGSTSDRKELLSRAMSTLLHDGKINGERSQLFHGPPFEVITPNHTIAAVNVGGKLVKDMRDRMADFEVGLERANVQRPIEELEKGRGTQVDQRHAAMITVPESEPKGTLHPIIKAPPSTESSENYNRPPGKMTNQPQSASPSSPQPPVEPAQESSITLTSLFPTCLSVRVDALDGCTTRLQSQLLGSGGIAKATNTIETNVETSNMTISQSSHTTPDRSTYTVDDSEKVEVEELEPQTTNHS